MYEPKPSGKQTLVEEGTELKGTLKSSCQVVVNGSIDGQIEAPSLTVTQTGTVLGSVKAQKLRSDGTLAGDIDAEDVYLSGTVRSNTLIRAKKLEVKLAPERGKLEVTFGECQIDVGEDPANREEPAAENKAEQAPMAMGLGLGMGSEAKPLEPTWSEPPGGSGGETAAAGQGDAQAEDAGESGGGKSNRKKKNSERRESQAPPAS